MRVGSGGRGVRGGGGERGESVSVEGGGERRERWGGGVRDVVEGLGATWRARVGGHTPTQ